MSDLRLQKNAMAWSEKLEELTKQGPSDSCDDISSELFFKHARAIYDWAWNSFMTFAEPQGIPGDMDYVLHFASLRAESHGDHV